MEDLFIADVFSCVLYDDTTNDAIGTATLQEGQIDVKVQENDIRGGRGDQLLGVLHSDRDINITLTDVAFRYDFLAKQLGQDITTGAGIAWAQPKPYTVSGSTVILDHAPDTTDPALVIYTEDGQKISGFTVTGNSVDLTSATPTVASGDVVEVRTYKYATDATTQTIVFDNAVFAKGVRLAMETIEITGDEVIKNVVQYQFDKAVPQGNFTLDTKSQRQATTHQSMFRVIKPANSTVVGRSLRFPYAG